MYEHIAVVDTAIAQHPLDPDLIDETIPTEEELARQYLDTVATSLKVGGLRNVRTEVPHRPPVEAIVACATEVHAELSALMTHGHSGVIRLIRGSVADGVVRKAPCPTLLVRASES